LQGFLAAGDSRFPRLQRISGAHVERATRQVEVFAGDLNVASSCICRTVCKSSDKSASTANCKVMRSDASQCGKATNEMAEVHGNRTNPENVGKTVIATQRGAKCGALATEYGVFDTGLQSVIDVWPSLSEDVKAGIVAMVRVN
jgi:hypothetical protein